MNNAENAGAVTFGTALGIAAQKLWLLVAIPPWVGQIALTVMASSLAFTANYYLKKFFDNRRAKRKADEESIEHQKENP